jgi:hypothetical protein
VDPHHPDSRAGSKDIRNVEVGGSSPLTSTEESKIRQDVRVTTWEYLIVSLPRFKPPTHSPGASTAVRTLNEEGERGWEAVGMTTLEDGSLAVLFKRPAAE